MRLGGDGAVGHRPGVEPREDVLDRLDLLHRDRRAGPGAQGEHPAQRAALAVEPFDLGGVGAVDVLAAGAGGVLEQEDRVRVEQVQLALAPVGVLAAHLQAAVHALGRVLRVRAAVAGGDLGGDDVEADAAELGAGAGEVLVQQVPGQAEGFEDLGTGVGADGGDAHLGHDLEHALDQGLHVVAHRPGPLDTGDRALGDQVLDGLERQVRVDRRRAVAQQQRHVVHLAGVAGLHDQRDPQPLLGAHQVVVHGRDQQQRRDGRHPVVGVAVGQHQRARARRDRLRRLAAHPLDGRGERRAAAGDLVESAEDGAGEAGQIAVVVDVDELGQLVVVDDRVRELDVAAGRRAGVEQVLLRAHDPLHRGDDLLADRVQRRVGDLGEVLLEVLVEQPRALREHRGRGVGAHRADRLGPGDRHRRQQDLQLLLGVAEGELAAQHRLVGLHDVLAAGQVGELEQPGVQPLPVGLLGGQGGLDLVVVDEPSGLRVHQEHPARPQPALGDHPVRGHVEDTGLAGQHHPVVGQPPPARRAQPVAVEHGADQGAVGEGDARRAVPGLHQPRVELVEGPPGRVHRAVVLPGLRDHHQHRVRQAAPTQVQQLQHLVEGRGVRTGRVDHRVEPIEVAADQVRGQQRLAGAHPVAVAADGVDLAVVRDVAERVRQRPRREGVGGEAGVHQRDGGDQPLVGQVGEEGGDLGGGQHSLVDHRARGQRREVGAAALGHALALHPLAQAERQPVQRHPGHGGPVGRVVAAGGQERHGEVRHDPARGRPDARGVGRGRHLAPAQHRQPLLGGDPLEERDGLGALVGVGGQEGQAGGVAEVPVGARLGEGEADLGAQQRVGQLHQDARAVTAGRLRARGAAVLQVGQRGERVGDDPVRTPAQDVGHHGDTAGVVLRGRVVQALGARQGGEDHVRGSSFDVTRSGRAVPGAGGDASAAVPGVWARDGGGPRGMVRA
ncbi:hypothetical protein UO65_1037 [Actinokineospora spheciospongiae]|uniref:Uncharacterized protein n=1 Tax=Actinokineospora spheciospongiae TaxID=909613 RepID=W7IRT5_9PSEU|nr:hypothetical protein UO65_1037 [Actinokineospora spheciospongiae]